MKKKCFFVLLLTIAMTTIQAQNPFFSAYKTPYDTPPFNKIKNEHYEPAIEKGIAEHQAEINKIVMKMCIRDSLLLVLHDPTDSRLCSWHWM